VRDGVLPPALLFAALGLALGLAPRNAWRPSLLSLLASIAAVSAVPIPRTWVEGVFFGCWISVIATAASVHLDRRMSLPAALALSLNAGIWASAVATLSGSRLHMLMSLPCVLLVFAASWFVGRHNAVPIKVASSWIIAIAALAAALHLLPVTPGYLPDHME
jgi:hypothetical protein